MIQSSFDYGCITHTKNCFCTHGSLYGCDMKCTAAGDGGAGGKVASWYAGQCDVSIETANAALGGAEASSKAPEWKRIRGRKLHWYEIMAISVCAATLVTLVAVLLWLNSIQKAAEAERQKIRWRKKMKAMDPVANVEDKKGHVKTGASEEPSKSLKEKFKNFDRGLRSRIRDATQDAPNEKQPSENQEGGVLEES
jgi:hypothetical protein